MAEPMRAQQYFQLIMGDIQPLTEDQRQAMDPVFEYMQQVRGKPSFDSTAQVYDILTGDEQRASYSHEMMWNRIVKTTDTIASFLPKRGCLLDLGSNTGHQPLFWATINPELEVHGIEISPLSCEVAERWKKKKNTENCTFHNGNFFKNQPLLAEKEFDVITSCFSMETVHEFYSEYNSEFPQWIIDSLSDDGRVIAFLTVPNASALEQIITQWELQGLLLNSIEMVKTPQDHHVHPLLILSKTGEPLILDAQNWFSMEAARLLGSLWIIHNPENENPFMYGEYDDYNLEHCIQYPMRVETWRFGKGYQFPDANRAENSLVIELSHPNWVENGFDFCLTLQFITYEGSTIPKTSIRSKDGLGDVSSVVMNSVQDHLEEMENKAQQPMQYLVNHVEALQQMYG